MVSPSRRTKRTRLCLACLIVAIGLQALVYYHVTVQHTTLPSSSSSLVLTDSLRDFLSHSAKSFAKGNISGALFSRENDQQMPLPPPATQQVGNDTVHATTTNSSLQDPHLTLKGTHSSLPDTYSTSGHTPDWFKAYVVWNREQRMNLTRENWKSKRYLVMQCLATDDRCGGTADRLKPIPTLLWMAHQYKRLLLIRWERPAKLEAFLRPTAAGIDWRVPEWMDLGRGPLGTNANQIISRLNQGNRTDELVVRSRYQSNNGGADYYNENVNGSTFEQVYHDIWSTMFEPVPAIQQRIQETMDRLHLSPGNYAAAHLRAVYAVESRDERTIKNWAINAANCASQLRPGGPIYFCSDSKHAVEVVQEYAKAGSKNIVSLIHEKEPLHLEKTKNWTNREPSEYYDTFVDLYLLGMSRCVAYNVGGFGKWGLLLSYNSSCGYQHAKRRGINKCEWAAGPTLAS